MVKSLVIMMLRKRIDCQAFPKIIESENMKGANGGKTSA